MVSSNSEIDNSEARERTPARGFAGIQGNFMSRDTFLDNLTIYYVCDKQCTKIFARYARKEVLPYMPDIKLKDITISVRCAHKGIVLHFMA